MRVKDLRAIVLAAGQGTRMRSDLAKVLHPLQGRPMITFVLDALAHLESSRTVVVVGHQADRVREVCAPYGVQTVLQAERLGTGHAVQQAHPLLAEGDGLTAVLCGDVPLLRPQTIRALIQTTRDRQAAATVLTALAEDPTGYGRIVRDAAGQVVGIVEHKDATVQQREIREYNTGTYCFANRLLWPALARVDRKNAQGEYYLTDVVGVLVGQGHRVEGLICADEREVQGINTVEDLQRAERDLEAMRRG
jgi:bifunctional UDP-N-acetylglucosamine pyrophosphorylase/glucosamine-1-phosphate N-acetyltransferase